jgi:hypothetical protein
MKKLMLALNDVTAAIAVNAQTSGDAAGQDHF